MTTDDIARELGVSKSTVSRALSGKGRISQATRQKIQDFVRENGIQQEKLPDSRDAGKAKTQNIAVVIPTDAYSESIPFFHECLLGISEVAAMLRYHVLIVTGTMNDISDIQKLVELDKVDGVILLRSVEGDRVLKYLADIQFPTGLVGTCDYDDVVQVDVDNRLAAESLVSILIGQGYRKFAMVAGDMGYRVNKSRVQGYRDALEKQGIPVEQQLYYPNFTRMELIDSVINDVLGGKAECIVCGDDVICTRLMSRLQAEGWRIPRDVSIVSLCSSSNLDCFSPAVTVIHISSRREGSVVCKQLINRLNGENYEKKTTLTYEVMLRKSIGRLYRG